MKVTIFGLGAIGSNLLVQFVKQYPDFEYVGIDFDKVEERNIRTQAYFVEHVGLLKSAVIRAVLQRYARKIKYTHDLRKVDASFPLKGPVEDDLYIDCFDNSESRRILTMFDPISQTKDLNILHLGFSPFYTAECIWNKDYDVPGDVDQRQNDICSMVDAVGFINFFVNAALLNISEFVGNKRKSNFIITNKTRIKLL